MKYAKFSDDFLSDFRLDDNGETLVLTDKRGYTRAVKLLPYEERTQGDLISREALKKCAIPCEIHNAPTVEPQMTELEEHFYHRCGFLQGIEYGKELTRPQGEYVDISKLRLMTVEECAGHTIDYAMGWKACIEWIKKGGNKCK